MSELLAYHGKEEVKKFYVQRMKDHIKADELARGVGFASEGNEVKGCAVGCTLNNYDHAQYPIDLGIPEWIARLEDSLFEGMSYEKSKTFPLDFLEAIKPGANLEKIKTLFLYFVLKSVLDKFDHQKFPNVLKSINTVLDLLKKENARQEELEAARAAAWDAEAAARAAAWDAAWAARAAAGAAAWAAEAAARAAALAADGAAAWAAEAAAWAAAWAAALAADGAAAWAADARAAEAAEAAARAAEHNKFADKLIKLLRKCP